MTPRQHGSPVDFVVVGLLDDPVMAAVAAVASDRGRRVLRVNVQEFVARLTIEGREVLLDDQPLPPTFIGFDPCAQVTDAFLRMEIAATAWAGSAMSSSRVVNRAGPVSPIGRMSYWPAVSLLRARSATKIAQTPTLHVSELELVPAEYGAARDLLSGDSFYLGAQEGGGGPCRARRVVDPGSAEAYEVVTVLGDKGWVRPPSQVLDRELVGLSCDLVQSLEQAFATITWAVSPKSPDAQVVAMNPFPQAFEIGENLGIVARALTDYLVA